MHYFVRKQNIGRSAQLDQLALECGRLYSQIVVEFWRTVRKHRIWLKPASMMRWLTSTKLHAHTADATVQAFYASLNSWRARRRSSPNARPPRRRRRYFRIEYKNSAIRLRDGKLLLSNGKGNEPVVLNWPHPLPRTLIIRWQGEQYQAVATYQDQQEQRPSEQCPSKSAIGDRTSTAGLDLGEVHIAVSHDGERCHILNGRYLRSRRRYQNKLKSKLSALIDNKHKASRRRKRLIRSKRRQLKRLDNQIRDVLHKQTTALISTLHEEGVQRVVIGDVRDIRKGLDYGHTANQRLHQWLFGKTRFYLTYKAQRHGMEVVLQEESYTSQTCPECAQMNKARGREYGCKCGFGYHRDGVGSLNIRQKYLGCGPVVGDMAPPIGIRYHV